MIMRLMKGVFRNNVTRNIIGVFLIKFASMCISFFSMPLYMKYFSDDSVLGAWYTILSIVNWIYIFDFGMGNSLRNKLVRCIEKKDYNDAKIYIETSYTLVMIIGAILSIIMVVLINTANMNYVLDVSSNTIKPDVFNQAVLILAIGVIMCFCLKTINAVLFSLQKSALTSLSTLVTSVFMLAFISVYKSNNQSASFLTLSLVHSAAIVVPLLITTVATFSTEIGRKIRPKRLRFRSGKYRDLLSLGISFFAIQLLSLFVISSNEIMITTFFDSSAVVEYSIYHKVFNMASSMFILAVTPIWSKITQYIVNKKLLSVRKTYRNLLIMGGIAAVINIGLASFLQFGLNIWLGEKSILVNYGYSFIFALYTTAYVFSIMLTTVANGMGKLKPQLVYYSLAALLKIPLIILLSNYYKSWIVVMVSMCIPMIIFDICQHISNMMNIQKQQKQLEKNI